MVLKNIVLFINPFINSIEEAVRTLISDIGLNPDSVGSFLSASGLFIAGAFTAIIVTVGIVGIIRETHIGSGTFSDNAIIKGKVGSILGVVSIVCAVWFLFALVYISLNNGI